MKIRNGFVSNSSSSSFLISGKKINFSEIHLNSDNNYIAICNSILNEGHDLIHIKTTTHIAMLYYKRNLFDFYDVSEIFHDAYEKLLEYLKIYNIQISEYDIYYLDNDELCTLISNKIDKNMFVCEIDNWFTSNYEDFKYRYNLDIDESTIMQIYKNYMRARKLNKIIDEN